MLVDRRQFITAAASTGLALGLSRRLTASEKDANSKIVIGVMGTGTRGTSLATTFAQQPNVEVAYVCDVDQARVAQAAEQVTKIGGSPQAVGDFRRILDDPSVDALVVATCNHWHAPASILACSAGKHVYVEKPCSHNPREGELMVEAARAHKRLVQMGSQRRSWPAINEAVQHLRDGLIGRAYLAQCWFESSRPSIGKGQETPAPAGLDYDLWQGPAPRRPFRDNYLHYNWHWFWEWGNGELGNNGIHFLDICRWGLGVDYPIRVSSAGGRYRFDDDQETPDTQTALYDFAGGKSISWDGLSCNRRPEGKKFDIVFHGETGSLAMSGAGYTVFDEKGKEIRTASGSGGDGNVPNFLAAVRQTAQLTSEIEEAHKSTLMCHLGNIAYRTQRTLHCDATNGHIQDDAAATALWTREYEPGWEPKIS